jgi:hypothetical protein
MNKAEFERDGLKTELEDALDCCPVAIRVREGGGPENLAASVAVSLAKFYHADEEVSKLRPVLEWALRCYSMFYPPGSEASSELLQAMRGVLGGVK